MSWWPQAELIKCYHWCFWFKTCKITWSHVVFRSVHRHDRIKMPLGLKLLPLFIFVLGKQTNTQTKKHINQLSMFYLLILNQHLRKSICKGNVSWGSGLVISSGLVVNFGSQHPHLGHGQLYGVGTIFVGWIILCSEKKKQNKKSPTQPKLLYFCSGFKEGRLHDLFSVYISDGGSILVQGIRWYWGNAYLGITIDEQYSGFCGLNGIQNKSKVKPKGIWREDPIESGKTISVSECLVRSFLFSCIQPK